MSYSHTSSSPLALYEFFKHRFPLETTLSESNKLNQHVPVTKRAVVEDLVATTKRINSRYYKLSVYNNGYAQVDISISTTSGTTSVETKSIAEYSEYHVVLTNLNTAIVSGKRCSKAEESRCLIKDIHLPLLDEDEVYTIQRVLKKVYTPVSTSSRAVSIYSVREFLESEVVDLENEIVLIDERDEVPIPDKEEETKSALHSLDLLDVNPDIIGNCLSKVQEEYLRELSVRVPTLDHLPDLSRYPNLETLNITTTREGGELVSGHAFCLPYVLTLRSSDLIVANGLCYTRVRVLTIECKTVALTTSLIPHLNVLYLMCEDPSSCNVVIDTELDFVGVSAGFATLPKHVLKRLFKVAPNRVEVLV